MSPGMLNVCQLLLFEAFVANAIAYHLDAWRVLNAFITQLAATTKGNNNNNKTNNKNNNNNKKNLHLTK